MHGDKRNFVTALVTLDEDDDVGVRRGGGDRRHAGGLVPGSQGRAVGTGCRRAAQRRPEQVGDHQDFRILARDLSVEDGELTPSLKIKRRVVETRYARELESMYTR